MGANDYFTLMQQICRRTLVLASYAEKKMPGVIQGNGRS
ncbi:hypothetical protein AXX16_3490 [Serratia rubidaea]|nr:hypothetical protein AXX16_3490 [Serratia rubidaea]